MDISFHISFEKRSPRRKFSHTLEKRSSSATFKQEKGSSKRSSKRPFSDSFENGKRSSENPLSDKEKVEKVDVAFCGPEPFLKPAKRYLYLSLKPRTRAGSQINLTTFVSNVMLVLLKLKGRKRGTIYSEFLWFGADKVLAPPHDHPGYYSNLHRVGGVDADSLCKREKGTTSLAFTCTDGVMLAVSHSSKEFVPNLIKVNSYMVAAISGGREYLLSYLQQECNRFESAEGRRIRVAEAAEKLTRYVSNRMCVRVLIVGLEEKGLVLCRMNRDRRLQLVEEKWDSSGKPLGVYLATGSGAEGAVTCLEHLFRYSMTEAEASELAKRAVCFSSHDSAQSGDYVSVYKFSSTGGLKPIIFGDNIREWRKENLGNAFSCLLPIYYD